VQAQEKKVVASKGKRQIVVPKGKTYVVLNAKGKETARYTAGQVMGKTVDCLLIDCPPQFPKDTQCWHCKERKEMVPIGPAKQ
jgi:hypothetical protein